ncbi:MAG: hypothetical protein GY771_17505 [bacterium]|nr:hypothetical protein [bacterium]
MVPRGIEILVKKDSVDPKFNESLLRDRSGAAGLIGLKLAPNETAMLDGIPETQLNKIIAGTKVSPRARPAFMGYAATAMLAALVGGSAGSAAGEGDVLSSDLTSNGFAAGDGDIIVNEIPDRLLACGTGIRPEDDIPEGEIVGPMGVVWGEVLTVQTGGGEVAYRSPDDIALKINPIRKTIATAYTNEANIDGAIGEGDIVIQFKITKAGKIIDADVISDGIDSSRLRNNILYALKTVEMKPASRDTTVVYSFHLSLAYDGP